jgi:pantoate kinase
MKKWRASVSSSEIIPEDVHVQAHDNVLRSMQQEKEMFELHENTLRDMLTIISSAVTMEEFPRQLKLILKELGRTPKNQEFSEEDAKVFTQVAALMARQYEQEVRSLMAQKEKAVKP